MESTIYFFPLIFVIDNLRYEIEWCHSIENSWVILHVHALTTYQRELLRNFNRKSEKLMAFKAYLLDTIHPEQDLGTLVLLKLTTTTPITRYEHTYFFGTRINPFNQKKQSTPSAN